MSEPITCNFIRTNGLAALTATFGILAKRHPQFPNLVFLKYSQITSPMAERIPQECRGLIVDEADDWRVVSYPFSKFFNHGEPNAVAIDWPTARVFEKLDGSLMTLYWYAGDWRVASNGTPDAGGQCFEHGFTFAELFWRVWRERGYRLPAPPETADESRCCYVFELMTPYNRVVVQHAANRLVLIGCRDLSTMEEMDPEAVAASIGWEVVRSHPLGTIEEVVAAAEVLDPMCSEGYVIRDGAFNRVKVKCPQYVALAHLKDSCTPRRLLEVIRSGESDEFLAYFPEMRPVYDSVRVKFEALCETVDADYATLRDIAEQKAFAIEAVKRPYSAALFSLRKGSSADARAYFAACTAPAAERAVGLDVTPAVTTNEAE